MIFIVQLLTSTVGRYLLAAASGILLLFAAYIYGRIDCSNAHDLSDLKASNKSLKLQLENYDILLSVATERERAANKFVNELGSAVDDYETIIAKETVVRSCLLNRRDVERMRKLAPGRTTQPTASANELRTGSLGASGEGGDESEGTSGP